MKISNDFPVPELDPSRKTERTEPVQPVRGHEDPVHLSDRAQELSSLAQQAQSVPEARSERLDAIQQAVSENRYDVSAERVAESLLRALSEFPDGI